MDSQHWKKCQDHPDEYVIGMCREYKCGKVLLCGKCILTTDHNESHKKQFLTINDFISYASKMFETFKQSKLLEEKMPQEYLDILTKQDENVDKLTQHFQKEKKSVEDFIQKMLKLFDEICKETKRKVFEELDSQIWQLKNNYQIYKSKLEMIYNKEGMYQTFSTKDAIVDKLKQCENLRDYESAIKELNEVIYERQALNEIENANKAYRKETLQKLTDEFNAQINSKPHLPFTLDGFFDKLCDEVKDSVQNLLTKYFTLQKMIKPLPTTDIIPIESGDMKSSRIIKHESEVKNITDWISNKPVKYTLLYRGSRDGYSYENVHSKIKSSKPTVCLIEATTGRRFGAYTDQDWTYTNNWKASSNTFIFSISDPEKYALKKGSEEYGLYCDETHLVGFCSSGIILTINGNINSTSYSTLVGGHIENNGKSNEHLAGSRYFQIKELETYQVDFL